MECAKPCRGVTSVPSGGTRFNQGPVALGDWLLPPLIGITKVFPHRWFTFTSRSRTGRTKQWNQPNQTKPAGDHLERFCKTRYLNHHTNLTGYALENVSYRGCILLPEWATRVAADSAIWDCLKTCQLGRHMSWNGAKYKVDPAHYSPKSEPPPPPPPRLSRLELTSSHQCTG